MIRKILGIFFLGLAVLFFPSCASKKQLAKAMALREEGRNYFVQTKDRYYDTEKIKTVMFIYEIKKFKLKDGSKISAKEVIAYQNREGYFVKVPHLYGEENFARRVIKGRICFYSIYISGKRDLSGSSRKIRYIQKDNGRVTGLNYEALRQMVSDHPATLAYVEQYPTINAGKRLELIFDVIAKYNEAMKVVPVK
jgi:hypothetical protein